MAFRWISNQPGRLVVVVLATPNENVFCKSSITHHDFPGKSF